MMATSTAAIAPVTASDDDNTRATPNLNVLVGNELLANPPHMLVSGGWLHGNISAPSDNDLRSTLASSIIAVSATFFGEVAPITIALDYQEILSKAMAAGHNLIWGSCHKPDAIPIDWAEVSLPDARTKTVRELLEVAQADNVSEVEAFFAFHQGLAAPVKRGVVIASSIFRGSRVELHVRKDPEDGQTLLMAYIKTNLDISTAFGYFDSFHESWSDKQGEQVLERVHFLLAPQ
jgi:hypothetical protein